MPTFNFFVYLLFIAGAYIFRLGYLGWFGPYLLAVVAIAPLLLVLLSIPAMLRMQVRLNAPSRVKRFAKTKLAVGFNARSLLPVGKLKVSVEMKNKFTGESFGGSFTARSLAKHTVYLPLSTQACGVIECRVTSYSCGDLLGMFSLKRKGGYVKSCAVVPLPRCQDPAPNIDAALERESILVPKHGGGYAEEHDLREYQPGDMPNSIHWKLSSKLDKYIVREPLVNPNNEIFLVLDAQGDPSANLEVLVWLSAELLNRELEHTIVSGQLHHIGNEQELNKALFAIMSTAACEPTVFNEAAARCVFHVSDAQVRV